MKDVAAGANEERRDPLKTAQARKTAISGFIGSALEYYDFFVYGSAAALVFGDLFFPTGETSVLLSIATLGLAYLARPAGAIFWGHVGDKYGRKRALVATIGLMGTVTFLIGCLPTYDQVGILAPIILVLLRLLQGISAGGESPGSASLTIEHAPEDRRGFFASFTMGGIMLGTVLSSLVFLPVASLPDEDLHSWGWRVPFWASAVVTVVALFVRRTLEESEVFEETRAAAGESPEEAPLTEIARSHIRPVVRSILFATFCMINTMVNVFGLSYGIATGGISRASMITTITLANLLAVLTTPLYGHLSDRLGRRPVIVVGLLGAAIMSFAFFYALEQGSASGALLTGIVLIGIFYSAPNSVGPSYFPEQFPARVRYSGMSIGLMTGLVVAGFTPAIAESFEPNTSWLVAASLCASFAAISGIAVWLGPETSRLPTRQLGLQ
ncbi:MHS family MFS transporter [Pseudonocardia kujensis]|uniref:MFS transporter n=1 Tax=Pseudonocardia kujensis TaxID=1128675 RepID=UPI001E336CF0|nr:MFS transporter [Pseudonocardia kujensis]MCE0764092.1 MHS family MFS transporter [Pseudonocardia kujensis]